MSGSMTDTGLGHRAAIRFTGGVLPNSVSTTLASRICWLSADVRFTALGAGFMPYAEAAVTHNRYLDIYTCRHRNLTSMCARPLRQAELGRGNRLGDGFTLRLQ